MNARCQVPYEAMAKSRESAGTAVDRSIATLNFALAAARDDTRVLMIDADCEAHKLSNKMG